MASTAEFCLVLDGDGGAKPLNLEKVPNKSERLMWIHIDYTDFENQEWLKQMCLDPRVIENLIDDDTSPRYFQQKNGILVVMRGVNTQKSADVDDMIALHMWIEKNRILTLSHRSIPSIRTVKSRLKKGIGPKTPTDVFIELANNLTEHIETAISKISDDVDALEEAVIEPESYRNQQIRDDLSELRHKIVGLRRYLVPQRDVAKLLRSVTHPVISAENSNQLRELYFDLTKAVEDLNSARDHSTVTREELDARTNVNLNQTMYAMSIVIVIFTPLTFITGLLGSNIGGIPFHDNPLGFWIITSLLACLGVVVAGILKKIKWF